jgi:hypothetical protein
VEQAVLGDVRGADVGEALLDVPATHVVLHLPLDDAALGVEDHEAGAELVGEGVEVEVAAELAVVALLGLLEPVQVRVERLLGLPGGAVDALELLVLLVAAPVRRGRAHQLERRDPLGGRQVRAAAQVAPRHLAVAAEVVVDGQLARAHFSRGTFDRFAGRACRDLRSLQADQFDLVGLVLELVERVGVGGDPPGEPLALLDDLAHPGLDLLEVLGHERGLDVEVVVEAVPDRRPDPEPRVGVEVLDRLRHHVRGRVPQDVVAVGAVDRHALDLVAVLELVGEVLERSVDARGDDVGLVLERLPRLGARRDRTLLTLTGADEGDLEVGHAVDRNDGPAPAAPRFPPHGG